MSLWVLVAALAMAGLAAAVSLSVGRLRGSLGFPASAAGRPAPPPASKVARAPAPAVPEPVDPAERCELRVFRGGPDGVRVVALTRALDDASDPARAPDEPSWGA
ncbi:MAG: hypothetical protein IRY99_07910, partial [Isosphaeraceae bacterium]|nr:hypothetical protein [Isosphaeraceae bacterium]